MNDALLSALLSALLTLVGADHARARLRCIERRRPAIVAQAAAVAASRGVPPGVLLVVGYLESHYGCDPASGGSWGSPVDREHRLTAGTADHTGRDLQTSRARFSCWLEALSRYRCGRRVCPLPMRQGGYSPGFAIGLVERVYAAAGQPAPADLRPPPSPGPASAGRGE